MKAKRTSKLKRGANERAKARSQQRVVLALGREIFEAALKHRREVEGFNDGSGGWESLSEKQQAGWRGVGMYVSQNFKRQNAEVSDPRGA